LPDAAASAGGSSLPIRASHPARSAATASTIAAFDKGILSMPDKTALAEQLLLL
jgi:hypothetical protein